MRSRRSIFVVGLAARVTTVRLPGVCLLAAAALAAGCGRAGPTPLSGSALRDPVACKSCHPSQYDQWSGSMHAFSSDDPVFAAMNRRAQRESGGALGDFCVKCHAPVALRAGLTSDGLDLPAVAPAMKGVTCYFCHAAESVDGTHNNPLTLAPDDNLFGPFADAAPGSPHRATYSALFDETQPDSAAACGSCHDIVNLQGAHVERTYQEWQGTLFAKPPKGLTCVQCHMAGSDGPASTVSSQKVRRLHSHTFPAVDLAVTAPDAAAPPNLDAQRAEAQAQLDSVVQSTICLNPTTSRIELTLENVGAGHGWPSGASPDRRGWVELTAYAGGQVLYSSGGAGAAPLEGSPDPDLWLIRDCLFDGAQQEVRMFWQAASAISNQLPGAVTASLSDPVSFALTHVQQIYPGAGAAALAQMPDRITVKVHLQAIGDDILQDLIATGDLDPSIPGQIARFELGGAALEWTVGTSTPILNATTGIPSLCVTSGRFAASTVPAQSHARCAP
jgi:hypothetical protein